MHENSATDVTIEQSVLAIASGDHTVFDALYRKTSPAISRLIASLEKDAMIAEDILQETYEILWTKASNLRDPATFWGWLRRIAVNLTLRRQQQHRKKGWKSLLPIWFQPDPPAPDTTRDVSERLDLESSLAQLPAADRAILILRELHGYSYEEMSDILSIPIGTVKSRLHASRKKILNQLQTKGTPSHA